MRAHQKAPKPNKFKPGDEVMFTGPYLFKGQVQSQGRFEPNMTYTVQDHSHYKDQWIDNGGAHVLIDHWWVDEDCLDYALTDEDVQAAIDSILRGRP